MAERHRVKITVLTLFSPSEVAEESVVTPVEPALKHVDCTGMAKSSLLVRI